MLQQENEAGSFIYQHPKYKEIEKYELRNKEQLKAASLVYLDLCEAKQWWNLDLHPCCELDLVFISGHATRHTPRELVLPLPRGCTVTPSDLQTYLHTLNLESYHTSGITMAIMDTDSTTVYYKISDGLVPPASPETTEKKKLYHTERINKRRIDVIASVNKYIEKKRRSDSSNETEGSKTEHIIETHGTL
ncbi:tRNA-splicing endonuclease subunit Sen15-like [Mizuhopecten yessoensis]|uniref:tRNA-splicing endonuclease subunit Sen15 n=1 Tax=Mizuhopecten yessoensis TaxID=6573 RepID=A0A210Q725_MIZYE|nr:tRNA-splicing endonuclease subunit Sen15-like [Mizuhopecten yessoensis]OWF44536.1 tRNA-splicing endonuclease subunit Sen15 [Mizuhopecten yessoensis]